MAGGPRAAGPSWRRLIGATVALFGILLAFLAGRVHAGADPALHTTSAAPAARDAAPAPQDDPDDPGLEPDDAAPAPSDAAPPATHAS
jgi:hypothetical protein